MISPEALLGGLRDSVVAAFSKQHNSHDLRSQLAEGIGVNHWILTNSGRSALSAVLFGLRMLYPGRDEVVIPAYTSYSVPAAVVRAGLRVCLCDIELETLGLSSRELERVITPRTLCVVANHLYGVPCDVEAIREVADHQGVSVVEDAAQGMGVRCGGRPAGAWGEAVIFSLSRGKSLPAAGGGLIGTNNGELADWCSRLVPIRGPAGQQSDGIGLRSVIETAVMAYFIRPSLYWLLASLPFLRLGASIYDPAFEIRPMTKFQEALASRLLPGLSEAQAVREANAARLYKELACFNDVVVILPRTEDKGGFLRLPVLIRDPTARGRVLAALQREGLGASCGYPLPIPEIPELTPYITTSTRVFPVARKVSRALLTLPTHPWVRDRDIARVVEVFRQFLC